MLYRIPECFKMGLSPLLCYMQVCFVLAGFVPASVFSLSWCDCKCMPRNAGSYLYCRKTRTGLRFFISNLHCFIFLCIFSVDGLFVLAGIAVLVSVFVKCFTIAATAVLLLFSVTFFQRDVISFVGCFLPNFVVIRSCI